MRIYYATKTDGGIWRSNNPLGTIYASLEDGDNYINIFHCFDITELHKTNQIRLQMYTPSTSGATITEANLSLTGSIL